ncbi:hypothetical protein [Tumebacillus permanentifrigoris]|uniref:Uncharacterized protein n=1 Tax=Tumebacillus permanentifrigoris TaxID=378543 RepID=A0A316D4M3_9BACL|nr:hypothetical protein [Tumebacillus permanentifrigoris]PWK05258.1 hypothetical protein C7459_1247 [Tumebacillus permanentifrigoris]
MTQTANQATYPIELKWVNGIEWGEIEHPDYGRSYMTYWDGGPCYDTYSAPLLHEDGSVTVLRYCHDEGNWVDEISMEDYVEGTTYKFE